MRKLELTPRLQKVADWVPQGARLADVGTDHAYLPAWLLLNGRIASAIASDLRAGPLRKAADTCARYGIGNIELRLCGGLEALQPGEMDTIVIAGMGGETIASILAAAPWTADGRHTLLLQPMTKVETLRSFLAEHGYAIRREALVREKDTLYTLMLVEAGEMTLTTGQAYGGVKLTEDPLGDRYLIQRIVQIQSAIYAMGRSPSAGKEADRQREIVTALMKMREEWRHANCQTN